MPRVADRPIPTVGGHRPDVEPWPAQLHIGVERVPPPAYVYDDHTAFYDDPEGDYVYDDTIAWSYDRLDLFCQFHGLTITTATPDEEGVFDAGHVEMTLDNRDGSLSHYDAAGRLVDWIPGSRLDIWATVDGEDWWLFGGRVTAWRELADGTVEVEAFDAFADLNQFVAEWTPGLNGQHPDARLTAICVRHGFSGVTRFDAGTVTLLTEPTDRTPLEEMQQTAISDAGWLLCDADGAVTYRDRWWALARPDQETVRTFTDNYCDSGAVVVWDPMITTDDVGIINLAELTNIATPEITVSARDDDSIERHGPRTWPGRRDTDLWTTADDGQAVADYLVDYAAGHYQRVEEFALYLADPRQDLWRTGIDLRIGDLFRWVHEQPTTTGPLLVILDAVVRSIVHEITPEQWVTTVAGTRTVAYTTPWRYDAAPFTYDDPDPANIYVI